MSTHDSLLEAAQDALDQQRPQKALELAQEALELSPQSSAALLQMASALIALDRLEEAHEAYDLAEEYSPNDPEILAGYADFLICSPGEDRERVEEGLALCRRGLKIARKAKEEQALFEFLLLEGIGHNQLGDAELALKALEEALKINPHSAEAELERGVALFERCRFKEAESSFSKVIRESPEEAWAHHYLGLLFERSGKIPQAQERFAQARRLLPSDFLEPIHLSEVDFDQAVKAAVERIPPQVKPYLENAVIRVEPYPAPEDLLAENPPLSPTILGVFRGTSVKDRSVTSAFDHFPTTIVLYQNNLERFARTKEELIEQIGITLLHEVGHLVGLDEDDLYERGLD